jgi:ankyrin repeat protein
MTSYSSSSSSNNNTMATARELDLLMTCREGNLEAVRALLDAPQPFGQPLLNINAEDSLGETALHVASEHGHVPLMRLLLARGASFASQTICGWTPLHLAASCPVTTGAKGHVAAVQLLLETAAAGTTSTSTSTTTTTGTPAQHRLAPLLAACTTDGRTPLHIASVYGFTDVVRVLLEFGADPRALDQDGRTPLAVACTAHCLETLQVYLDHAATHITDEIHFLATDGYTPLHVALQEGRGDQVRFWLDCDEAVQAWLNHPAKSDGGTPLHCAIAFCRQAVPWLLARGADPAVTDHEGWSAWHWAADEGCLAVWEQLVAARSNESGDCDDDPTTNLAWMDCRTHKGETCLHIASRAGHTAIVQDILARQAAAAAQTAVTVPSETEARQVDARNHAGQTALQLACQTNVPSVVQALCQAGASPRARDQHRQDAFMVAKQRKLHTSLYLLVQFYSAAGGFARPGR